MKDPLAIALRPKTLDDLIGCETIVKRIRARIESGRIPKAIMLSGQTGCLTGDTLIDVPRDLVKHPYGIAIKELVDKRPYVYAFDRHKRKIVLVKAAWVKKTGEKVPVYKVEFEQYSRNYRIARTMPSSIYATSNHLFLTRYRSEDVMYAGESNYRGVGRYKRVKDLRCGDRLLPFCRQLHIDSYAMLHNICTGEKVYEHRFILSELHGDRNIDRWDGHHKNEHKKDNRIRNLEWRKSSEHLSYHTSKRNSNGTAGWKVTGKHPKGMKGKSQTSLQKRVASETATHRWKRWRADKPWYNKKLLCKLFFEKGLTQTEVARKLGTNDTMIRKTLRKFGLPTQNNHVVKSVKFAGYQDVYDIHVPGVHNFVANGVVVHNSGKTTIGRIIATALQCYHKVPFGSCIKCYNREKRFDIVELNMPGVSKAELESILEGASYTPKPSSLCRVYFFDEMHKMSDAAQTLLLKYTEDCPRQTRFISATTNPDAIIRTLRRRHKIYAIPPLELEDIRKMVKLGLRKVHSDLPVSELVEKLMEKNVTSPALILNAVESYAEGASVEEASEVEGTSTIDTLGLSIAVCKGLWPEAGKILQQAKPEDAIAISSSVMGYLRGILLGEQNTSKRAQLAADSIIKLAAVRGDISGVTAVLFKVCKHFTRNGA